MILLNPGPTNTNLKVKKAQNDNTDVCHRTKEFYNILDKTKNNLLEIFGNTSDFEISILAGSGTTALESMITSLINKKIIIINAGKYGQRAVDICNIYNIEYDVIESKNINDIKKDISVKSLYFVENETSTGENYCPFKIKELFPNAKLYIDATSSFGASSYKNLFSHINSISFCANKCLQSVPGLGIVIYKKNLHLIERTYQTFLNRYINNIPFTLPVQCIYALHESTKDQCNNKEIFDKRKDKLIKEFSNIGIKCLNKSPSNSIILFEHPTMIYQQLYNFCLDRGIVIYDNLKNNNKTFRVSTMSSIFDDKFNYIKKVFYDSCLY